MEVFYGQMVTGGIGIYYAQSGSSVTIWLSYVERSVSTLM